MLSPARVDAQAAAAAGEGAANTDLATNISLLLRLLLPRLLLRLLLLRLLLRRAPSKRSLRWRALDAGGRHGMDAVFLLQEFSPAVPPPTLVYRAFSVRCHASPRLGLWRC